MLTVIQLQFMTTKATGKYILGLVRLPIYIEQPQFTEAIKSISQGGSMVAHPPRILYFSIRCCSYNFFYLLLFFASCSFQYSYYLRVVFISLRSQQIASLVPRLSPLNDDWERGQRIAYSDELTQAIQLGLIDAGTHNSLNSRFQDLYIQGTQNRIYTYSHRSEQHCHSHARCV